MDGQIAEVTKKPSLRKLKQFIDKGGYSTLERMGEGKTSEERQIDGWKQHGIITLLVKQTGIAESTLTMIKTRFPTSKTAGLDLVWINKENLEKLNHAREKLLVAEKYLERINSIVSRSIIVDSNLIRMQQVVAGKSADEAFKNAVSAAIANIDKHPISELTANILVDLRNTRSIISDVQFSAKTL
ncbi:MAG: hypothetical protein NWE92_05385 [Candidatus Bathyarchaeota archaeon]|nr:hypothetical protein [Candidatus Bathyarchaeota archaeon]